MKKLINAKEVCEMYAFPQSTVYQWASTGCMPSYKVNGRVMFKVEDIESWLDNSCKRDILGVKSNYSGRKPRKGGSI